MAQTASYPWRKKVKDDVIPPMTSHALKRMNSRGISQDAVLATLIFGRAIHGRGAVICFIGRKEVEQFGEEEINLSDYEGVHVICSKNWVVLTTYRNRNFRDLRPSRRRPFSQRYGDHN